MITLTVTLEANDYAKLVRQLLLAKPVYMIIYGIATLLFICMLVLVVMGYFPLTSSVLLILLFFSFLLSYGFIYYPWQMAHNAEKNEMMRAPCVYELDENQIVMRNAYVEQKVVWSAYAYLFETKEYFFLYLQANKNMFHLIPKRAFQSEQQLNDFRVLAKSCIKKIN